MEKKIEQYLPLYLGQKVRTYSGCGILSSIDTDGSWYVSLEKGGGTVGNINDKNQPCPEGSKKTYPPKSILTLILRPLSSMTEEEERELGKIALPECDNPRSRFVLSMESTGKNSEGTSMMDNYTPEMVLWLLSKGFDIFRLKEKGLCLYPEEL